MQGRNTVRPCNNVGTIAIGGLGYTSYAKTASILYLVDRYFTSNATLRDSALHQCRGVGILLFFTFYKSVCFTDYTRGIPTLCFNSEMPLSAL